MVTRLLRRPQTFLATTCGVAKRRKTGRGAASQFKRWSQPPPTIPPHLLQHLWGPSLVLPFTC